MNYVVFEAGSRAGFSAEKFFQHYIAEIGKRDDRLIMVDDDASVNKVLSAPNVVRVSMNMFNEEFSTLEDMMIFPADELTRQRNDFVREFASNNEVSRVEKHYYDKTLMNLYLAEKTDGCRIKVPATFALNDVCIRPNSMSAGSKGLQLLDGVSVTQKLNIKEEYVVDVLRSDKELRIYPRQVVLKGGYDRMVKPIEQDSFLGECVKEFILSACPRNEGMFSNIFHLQLAKADDGQIYYIECSKRISGTSIVNIYRGMNPFSFINGAEINVSNPFKYDTWYRYEDFVSLLLL